MLLQIPIKHTLKTTGKEREFQLSYELYGQPLADSPIILINHALTGNSSVAGERGWWNKLVSHGGTVDLDHYTVLAFNIPGNGYDGHLFEDPKSFTLFDVASIFLQGLRQLGIEKLDTIIGGSLGGAIAWQMAYLDETISERIIPIATDFQASDWLIAHCHMQDLILNHSDMPLEHARQHAMLLYRTPQSLNQRFKNERHENNVDFKIASWLNYHGDALQKRFAKEAYALLNRLLSSIWVADTVDELQKINASVHMVSVNSDLYFTHERMEWVYNELKPLKEDVHLHVIESIHGHDAFLIEYEQLNKIVAGILAKKPTVSVSTAALTNNIL